LRFTVTVILPTAWAIPADGAEPTSFAIEDTAEFVAIGDARGITKIVVTSIEFTVMINFDIGS
jgi:hypothetical protein